MKLNYIESIVYENSIQKKEFKFPGSNLKLSGEEPGGGKAIIDTSGKIEFAIYDKDKRWCARKDLKSEKIKIDNYKKTDCILNSENHVSSTIKSSIVLYNEDQMANLELEVNSDSNISVVKYMKGKVDYKTVISNGTTLNKESDKYIISGIIENGYYTIYSQDEDGDYSLNYVMVEGIVILEGSFDDLYISGNFGELTQSWGIWKRTLDIKTKGNVNIVDAKYSKKYEYDSIDDFENDENYGNKLIFTNNQLTFTAEGLWLQCVTIYIKYEHLIEIKPGVFEKKYISKIYKTRFTNIFQ